MEAGATLWRNLVARLGPAGESERPSSLVSSGLELGASGI